MVHPELVAESVDQWFPYGWEIAVALEEAV